MHTSSSSSLPIKGILIGLFILLNVYAAFYIYKGKQQDDLKKPEKTEKPEVVEPAAPAAQ